MNFGFVTVVVLMLLSILGAMGAPAPQAPRKRKFPGERIRGRTNYGTHSFGSKGYKSRPVARANRIRFGRRGWGAFLQIIYRGLFQNPWCHNVLFVQYCKKKRKIYYIYHQKYNDPMVYRWHLVNFSKYKWMVLDYILVFIHKCLTVFL